MLHAFERCSGELVGGRHRGSAPRGGLRLEVLEERTLPTVTLSNGFLRIFGSDDPDTYVIRRTDDRLIVIDNGAQSSFQVNQVQEILVDTHGGSNRVDIDSIGAAIDVTVAAGSGNDDVRICPTS